MYVRPVRRSFIWSEFLCPFCFLIYSLCRGLYVPLTFTPIMCYLLMFLFYFILSKKWWNVYITGSVDTWLVLHTFVLLAESGLQLYNCRWLNERYNMYDHWASCKNIFVSFSYLLSYVAFVQTCSVRFNKHFCL